MTEITPPADSSPEPVPFIPETEPVAATPNDATTAPTPNEAIPIEPVSAPAPNEPDAVLDEHQPDEVLVTNAAHGGPNAPPTGEMRDPEGVTLPSEPPPAGGPPNLGPPYPAAPYPPAPAHAAPYPSAPYPQAPRRIYRSRHDRKVGGVSAGVAEYFGIDPTIVRLATLLFAITGVGVLLYIAGWLIIPERPEGLVEPHSVNSIASERTLTLAFGIAALALAFGITTGSWEVLAIALIGGGIWLLSEHTSTAQVVGFAGAANPATQSAPVTDTVGLSGYSAPRPASSAPGSVPPPPPTFAAPVPAAPRQPQRITRAVFSILALLIGLAIAASTGNWWDVSATRFLGAGVVVIGIGVLAGQIRGGGARGLIPLGLLAALMLFPVSAVDGLIIEGIGETTFRPTTIAQLQPSYEHGIGQMTVDLSQLDFDGQDATVDIDLGIGELIVIVSENTGGQAVLQAKAGELSHQLPATNSFLFDDGVNIESGTVLLQGENGSLNLTIDVGFGTAELRSEPAQ